MVRDGRGNRARVSRRRRRALEMSNTISPETLRGAVAAAIPLAEQLFAELRDRTADGAGVSRESYGAGEQCAHDLIRRVAGELALEITNDPFGNLYATLPGRERSLPAWLVGSHLDSVPRGGNFDGAAGVIAGIGA